MITNLLKMKVPTIHLKLRNQIFLKNNYETDNLRERAEETDHLRKGAEYFESFGSFYYNNPEKIKKLQDEFFLKIYSLKSKNNLYE